jgi:hypothetical protein
MRIATWNLESCDYLYPAREESFRQAIAEVQLNALILKFFRGLRRLSAYFYRKKKATGPGIKVTKPSASER